MNKFIIFISFILTVSSLIASQEYEDSSYFPINCAIHVHSKYSGSNYTISNIVNLAKDNEIDCVFLTDHFLKKVEYGLWPFRNIIKKTQKYLSVMDNVDIYLSTIHQVNNIQKDVIIIPSLEITPHYYWEVDKENNALVAYNLHKHMLLLNISDPNLYKTLPVIGNELNSAKFNIFSFWPLLVLLLAFFLKSKFLALLALVFLAINFPFKRYYDQYHNYKEKPYQYLIDFVNDINVNKNIEKNMIIIWAHPESPSYEKIYFVKQLRSLKLATQTKPYFLSLLNTYDYDGFAIFAEGYREVGSVGGIWDKILLEYCEGKRKKPVWCFSELDFGETTDPINSRLNVVFVREKNQYEIINALKSGNFYALWRSCNKELQIFDFKLNNKPACFGKKYKIDKEVKLEFSVKCKGNSESAVVYIIRNAEAIYKNTHQLPTKIEFVESKPKGLSYYRIYIESKYPNKIATNPIFVE